ncbi:hypothetical protein FPQ18DRAFT_369647 [Pyronema domesticum]|nr:hypothetical protein FPQ18DRAFT_369647 [Pyronema domesticum]
MRLLNASTLKLKEFYGRIPKYAILSHTWAEEEKIWMTCQIASDKGFEYVWIDTCCIDKKSSADLSWFTRGWTLQELLAPSKVIFYSQDWIELGTKSSLAMEIERITMIDSGALTGEHTIVRKMSWAAYRKTTRPEDIAYCLIGIFNINMPILSGEGKRAFHRLQLEIMKLSHDQTLFAWMKPDRDSTFLAVSPNEFSYYRDFVACYSDDESPPSYSMTNTGIDIRFSPRSKAGPTSETPHLSYSRDELRIHMRATLVEPYPWTP